MTPQTRNPGAEAGAAGIVEALGGAIDDQQFTFAANENLVVAFIARRFHLKPYMARVVAELAQIGGRTS